MPTNKQRREAARRHLERQLQNRVASDTRRKQRNLILTIVASVILVVLVVAVLVAVNNDNHHKASATPTPAASASDTTTDTDSAAASTSPAAPLPQTAGPCGYSQAGTAAKDVGFPPDPNPTPTTARVVTFTTNQGQVTLTLDAANAPCTVQSIAYLVGKQYYDNTQCFRLVTSGLYVLQCGDALNTGAGTPGYEIKDENLDKADYSVVGTVAMANAGPGTDGSQFFIIYKDSSAALQKSYTVIGHITAGMDVIQKVAAGGETDTDPSQPGDGKPKIPLTIMTATVAPPVVGSGTMVTPSPSATAPAASSAAAPTGSATSTAPTASSGG